MPETAPLAVFKTPNLPIIPNDITPGLGTYLNQLNDLLLTHISPAMWVNDRLYELDQICGHRDVTDDFTKTDLTTDDDWHYLDLSSIVGKHECLVTALVRIQGDAADSLIKFRRKSDTYASAVCRVVVADVYHSFNITIPTNADGVIEYFATNITWTYLNVRIVGWRPIYVIGG